MFSEQPTHDTSFMGKGLSAGMLITEAPFGKERCRTHIQHGQGCFGCLCQGCAGQQLECCRHG